MASTLLFLFSLLLLLLPLPSFSQTCSSQTFSKNRLFATCNDLRHLSAALHWTYDAANSTLSIAFVAPPSRSGGWVAWALNPTGSGMVGAQAVVGLRQSGGSLVAKTFNISAYGPVTPSPIAFETWGLEAEEDAGGVMTVFAMLKLPSGVTRMNQAWQVGPSSTDGLPNKHDIGVANLNAKGTLDVVSGQSSGGKDSRLQERNIHGILNAVSWGILLPIGAIIARYLKAFKSLAPAWFYLHVLCQLIGYALGVTGWGIGLNLGSKSKGVQYTTHRNLGITLFSLATLQITALFLRPKKDHKYRVYWNLYHHVVGMAIILLGIINVFRGLQILNPAQKWKDAYIVVLCFLGGITLVLEVTTCIIARRRKSDGSTKQYNGSGATNDQRSVQQPLSV
ncbi:cytochrome b561 and DOMON domain-containing protein At4g12980-like [Phoenix dactylifera]|uniref:Cytochrome b561 and DOMON domain-containing protein n=1 Tax=Phoenix dactylifera TaxID=42345 RepID=A0A8B7BJS3_PHODC|nr:cytochrome b561 and DOMON domain-containing protein At4g12980-like [Phoenix dactylifera]